MPTPKDKRKFQLWARPGTLELVKSTYKKADCRTQSEFIEKAIQYYVGRINADNDASYLPNAFLSNMRSIVYESDHRENKLLFKLAVEMSIMMNILAFQFEIDDLSLARLRGECVKEVKRTHGMFSMEDAVKWQRSVET